uniref:Uncharacterized protein n=1 Tax=Rhizophora mucronata TaxID=61149 RepID=A0A2P2Q5X9_RHIMU
MRAWLWLDLAFLVCWTLFINLMEIDIVWPLSLKDTSGSQSYLLTTI